MEKLGAAGQATDDKTIRCMRVACWLPKATDTQSECKILFAFPRKNWLHERASISHST